MILALLPGAVGAQGRVHSDPASPAAGFKPHQLPFELPGDSLARAEYRSQVFYAVLLRTTPPCTLTEAERLDVQALWPDHKVFFPKFGCEDDPEETITYTNVNPAYGFLAVYAGATREEGEKFLRAVQATGRFPGANLRRMEAVLVYP